jgi:hypothetical protein
MAAAHNVVRALDAGGIGFPISKKDLLAKVGEAEIRIDFDKKISLSEYCSNIKIDNFENKAQFFCALTAANTAFA